MKFLFSLFFGLLLVSVASAQDTSRQRAGSLFADTDQLTEGDYLMHIQKAYQILNHVHAGAAVDYEAQSVVESQTENLTELQLIQEALADKNSKAMNLRSLQMFRTLLMDVQRDLNSDGIIVTASLKRINTLKDEMKGLRSDTVMQRLLKDTSLHRQYIVRLSELRTKWRQNDTLIRGSLSLLNDMKARNADADIAATELMNGMEGRLRQVGKGMIGKEYGYIWQPTDTTTSKAVAAAASDNERKALKYYFKDSWPRRIWMLLSGVLFFIWVSRNFRKLQQLKVDAALEQFNFLYLKPWPVSDTLVLILSMAPLFDMHAPIVYVESMLFFLLIVLTIVLWRIWSRGAAFYNWVVIVVLFLLSSFMHNVVAPNMLQRWELLLLSIASMLFAIQYYRKLKQEMPYRSFIRFAAMLMGILNGLSIYCNIMGRFSLAQVFGASAVFGLVQIIGLTVFVRVILEAILLQIQCSRLSKGLPVAFDFEPVRKSFGRLVLFSAVVIWLIVFTTNLGIYTPLSRALGNWLGAQRSIGSFTFSIGHIILFFFIIWVANVLQKHIGYLMGETGDDVTLENKAQRSKLLVTRLVLLTIGFLLAVAASGLPVDKITIIIGSLGVGIGLGLQNIVSNFVSGVILIFDRPLQIGDSIEIGGKKGRVKEIGLRSSTLLTSDGAEVIIPNGDMLQEHITNWTLSNNHIRLQLLFRILGTIDYETVQSLVYEAVKENELVMADRAPVVLFNQVAEGDCKISVSFWCNDIQKADLLKSQLRIVIHQRLLANGIQVA